MSAGYAPRMHTTTTRPQSPHTDTLDAPRVQPFGPRDERRQIAGASVIMAGAIPVALIAPTFYGRPPRLWSVLVTIGVVGLIAWVVDGRRYLGAAAASLAVGSALGISAEAGLDRYTFALLFGFLGIALYAVLKVNPAAVLGSVGLLLFASASAALVHLFGIGGGDPQPSIPQAWAYVPVMLAWGGLVIADVRRSGGSGAQGRPAPRGEVRRSETAARR